MFRQNIDTRRASWTHDFIDHMMVKVDAIIVLASMMHVVGLDYHKLHLMGEKLFNNFLLSKWSGLYT